MTIYLPPDSPLAPFGEACGHGKHHDFTPANPKDRGCENCEGSCVSCALRDWDHSCKDDFCVVCQNECAVCGGPMGEPSHGLSCTGITLTTARQEALAEVVKAAKLQSINYEGECLFGGDIRCKQDIVPEKWCLACRLSIALTALSKESQP